MIIERRDSVEQRMKELNIEIVRNNFHRKTKFKRQEFTGRYLHKNAQGYTQGDTPATRGGLSLILATASSST